MIHTFHGFLGGPSDFSFLSGKHHDLYLEDFTRFTTGPEDVLIGYSLGGRVAMEIARRNHFNLKRLIILSSHPGLQTSELKERHVWEESVLQRLSTSTVDDFLSYWNRLPLFKADEPLRDLSLEKLRLSRDLFEKYRLSRQENFTPDLLKHRTKVTWIAGTQDEKYVSIARSLAAQGLTVLEIEAGHRLLQHPDKLLKVLAL